MMTIHSLKVNHMTCPMGFMMDSPVFSFITDNSEVLPVRLRVSLSPKMDEIVYDSELMTVDPLGFKASMVLQPRTRYYWQLESLKTEEKSEISWFETGKRDEAWQAKFLRPCGTSERFPVMRKTLLLKKEVENAFLYICGLGLYEAYIGEERVSDEYLAPYCNNYDSFIQVQTYDITEYLEEDPTITVYLGDGWYKGRFGFSKDMPKNFYGDHHSLIAEIHVTYMDGTEEIFGTDETWECFRGSIASSNIYDGEVIDMTLPEEKDQAIIDTYAEENLKQRLTDRISLPVVMKEEFAPCEIIHTPKGETVLDMGQEITGTFMWNVKIPEGETIKLWFGEILQEGNFFNLNLRTARSEFAFTSDGEEHELRPKFTFHGYRYVKVEAPSTVDLTAFRAIVLHSDLDRIGQMKTGNELVNRLLSNIVWGQKGNFLDVPTDCPQRDERMGWTGDAQVFAPTASYFMDTYAFYHKYLYDMNSEQEKLGGMVPNVIPSFSMNSAACAWGDAATVIPWKVYVFTGDKKILEDHIKGMRAWVDYVKDLEENQDHSWEKQFHFGDWLALDHPDKNEIVLGATDEGFLAEVYYLYSTRLTMKAYEVLQDETAACEMKERAEKILAYIRENYFTPTGRCAIDTMTAHLLTIVHGLSADESYAVKGLKKLLKYSHGKLKTGFIGTPILCPVLSMIGEDKMAYDLLLNEEYPGWLYEVKHGATTIWERWNSVLEDGRLSDLTMNSLNHYAYGSIAEWMWRFAAGLDPVEEAPGFKMIRFSPVYDERLGHLEASYRSCCGTWYSEWKILEDGRVKVCLTVPEGARARVSLQGAKAETLKAFGCDENMMIYGGDHEVIYRLED